MLAGASHRALAVAATATLVGGGLTSVQARLNGELSVVFESPLDAALWSFGSGWVVLCLALLAVPGSRRALLRLPAAIRAGEIKGWQCFGGMAGGAFVAIQTYAVPLAGVAIFTIAVVGGQTGNALVVDRLGLAPRGRAPLTVGRAVAALVAVVGVGIAVSARGGGPGSSIVLPALLALFAGAINTAQQAINARVSLVTGSPLATTWLNFSMGLGFLVALAVVGLMRGSLAAPVTYAAPWWAFFGGLCGIAFIAIASVVLHYLGVLVFTLVSLVGQLTAAVGLDLLTPATRSLIGVQVLVGVVVTLLAAVGAGWSAQRARRRALGEA